MGGVAVRGVRALVLGTLVAILGACSTPLWQPREPTDQQVGLGGLAHYRFSGRIAIQQPGGSDSARIQWQQDPDRQQVTLLSPLGSTVAQLDRDASGVDLRLSDQERFHARDSEELTARVLGYSLPLEGLLWWVVGRAAPDEPARWQFDDQGRAQLLEQAGWRIEYAQWRPVGQETLPGLLRLGHGTLLIKLKIDQWVLGIPPLDEAATLTGTATEASPPGSIPATPPGGQTVPATPP